MEKMMTDILDNAAADSPAPSVPPTASANPDLRWYVVHAYSGFEKSVQRALAERIQRQGMQDKFGVNIVGINYKGGASR